MSSKKQHKLANEIISAWLKNNYAVKAEAIETLDIAVQVITMLTGQQASVDKALNKSKFFDGDYVDETDVWKERYIRQYVQIGNEATYDEITKIAPLAKVKHLLIHNAPRVIKPVQPAPVVRTPNDIIVDTIEKHFPGTIVSLMNAADNLEKAAVFKNKTEEEDRKTKRRIAKLEKDLAASSSVIRFVEKTKDALQSELTAAKGKIARAEMLTGKRL